MEEQKEDKYIKDRAVHMRKCASHISQSRNRPI